MSQAGVAGHTPFELDAMAQALRYQEWVIDTVGPYLGERILEIGSGIGTMTKWLAARAPTVATDIDQSLLARLRGVMEAWPAEPTAVLEFNAVDFTDAPAAMDGVDTVISFNVLEHIEHDEEAVRGMWRVLTECGPGDRTRRLIIFVPAHQWTHGAIDVAFGHYRRYGRQQLHDLVGRTAPTSVRIRTRYFNTFGLPGWFAMGKILKRPTFGMGSVRSMERLIPLIKRVDPFLHGRYDLPAGQSVLVVAEIPAPFRP